MLSQKNPPQIPCPAADLGWDEYQLADGLARIEEV
jgi:hypothetical protein